MGNTSIYFKIKRILKKEGFFSLVKVGVKLYVFPFLGLISCFVTIKNVRFNNLDSLVSFTFNGCYGFLAPMQIKSEITSFLNFVKNIKPKTILEIGTAGGGTLFLFSRVVPSDSFMLSIDLPGGAFGGGYPLWKMPLYKLFAIDRQTLKLLRDDSHDKGTLQKTKYILGNRKLDFLFIDGDHTYSGVKRDFELYSKLVRTGGVVAFHDIVNNPHDPRCGVSRFWQNIKKKYDYVEFVEDWDQGGYGIGLIKIK